MTSKKNNPTLDLRQLQEFQTLHTKEKALLFEVPEARQRLRKWLSDPDQIETKRKIFSIKVLDRLESLLLDPESDSKAILASLESGHVWSDCWQEPRLAAESARGKAADRWREVYQKSIEVRNEICLRYIEVTGWVAERYRSPLLDHEELQSQAFIGLIRACERFDPTRGTSFGSYARIWMRDFVMFAVRRQGVLSPGAKHYKELSRLDKVCAGMRSKLGREPLPEELAEEMGFTVDKLEELQGSHLTVTSLDLPLEGEGGEDGETLESVIGKEGAAPFERMEREKLTSQLSTHLDGLTEIERAICGFRWTNRLESSMRSDPYDVLEAIERMKKHSYKKIVSELVIR